MTTTFATVLAEIGWNPEIRNILSVLVGVVVLLGSVYLLVGSNAGLRTGALVTAAGLTGWMMTMAVIWMLYGIGLTGRTAAWHVEELNYSVGGYHDLALANLEEARSLEGLDDLATAQELIAEDPGLVDEILPAGLEPDVREARAALITVGQILEVRPNLATDEDIEGHLGGWRLLAQSDRARGDAVAASDAYLGPDGRGLFAGPSDYSVRDVFTIGGRDIRTEDDMVSRVLYKIDQIFTFKVPAQYAVVQSQAVVPLCEPDQEPAEQVCYTVDVNAGAPTPVLKEGAPTISVILVRDLGIQRVPSMIIFAISGVLFLLSVTALHRRDKAIAAVLAA